jgi:hypothetical protein
VIWKIAKPIKGSCVAKRFVEVHCLSWFLFFLIHSPAFKSFSRAPRKAGLFAFPENHRNRGLRTRQRMPYVFAESGLARRRRPEWRLARAIKRTFAAQPAQLKQRKHLVVSIVLIRIELGRSNSAAVPG